MSNFWSKRRAAVAQEERAEEQALVAAEAEAQEEALAERDDDELLAEHDLPQPEELDSPEAVREFLNSALPQRLKTRALRRLWRLNPVLANLDGLLDYGEDYTDAANVVENLQTAYQVGKGMLAHVEALAAQEEEAEVETEPEIDEAPDQARGGEDLVAEAAPETQPAPAPEPGPLALDETDDIAPLPATHRRMTFQFEGAA